MRGVVFHFLITASILTAQEPRTYPIESITIRGNQEIPAERILAALGLKTGDPATKESFDAARDRVMATGGFDGVGYKYNPNAAKTGYDAIFEVREIQPLYRYRFEELPAAEAALRQALRQQEPIFGDAIPATPAVMNRYSVALARLVNADHGSIEIIGEFESEGAGDPVIVFRPLGPRRAIAEVRFEGSSAIKATELSGLVNPGAVGATFTETRLRQMLDATLRPAYEQKGRLMVSFPKIVTTPSEVNDGVVVTVTVDEGAVYTLAAVIFEGADGSRVAELDKLAQWPIGNAADMALVGEGMARIRKRLREDGYLQVSVDAEREFRAGGHNVDLTVRIAAGPRFSMGKLTIAGLDILSEPQIRKLWTLDEGRPYRASYPDDFAAMIKREGFFANLSRIAVDVLPREDTAKVDVTLDFIGAVPVSEAERRVRGR